MGQENMGSYQHMESYSKGNRVIILGILPTVFYIRLK